MRIRPVVFGAVVLAVFFGTVGIAMAGGSWTTTGRTTAGGERVELSAGAAVTDVKGWMAVADVAETFGVPLSDLYAAFDIPADTDPSTPLKELESDTFSVTALRDWLADRADGTEAAPAP